MNRGILGAVAIALLTFSTRTLALSAEEERVIQQASARFLDGTPENNYLLAPGEVLARIRAAKGDFVLVDLRTAAEFERWRLPGAINIPYRRIAAPESLAKLPRDRDIILYCNSGHESSKVLSLLRLMEYRAFGMKWGAMSWRPVPATAATLKAIAEGTASSYPVEP